MLVSSGFALFQAIMAFLGLLACALKDFVIVVALIVVVMVVVVLVVVVVCLEKQL